MTNENQEGLAGRFSEAIQMMMFLWKDQWGLEPSISRIRDYVMFDSLTNVSRVMLEEAGPIHTLEAIKPINLVTGKQLADVSKMLFGPQDPDNVESLILPYYIWHCGTSEGEIKPIEIRDGKAVVELYECPQREVKGPPELCVAMSHIISEGICQAINPEYEYVWTHHLGNGDDRCRYVVKKKSARMRTNDPRPGAFQVMLMNKAIDFDPSDLGVLEKTIPLDLSQAERNFLRLGVAYMQLIVFTSAAVNLLGSQKLVEGLMPLAKKSGLELGNKLIEGSREEHDISMIKDKLDFLGSALNQKGEPTVLINETLEKVVNECPFKGTPPETCKNLEGVFNGVCEAINPDYEFVYDRMMSKGDSSCHWVVKKKGESQKKEEVPPKEQEKPADESATTGADSDDPLKRLANKLIDGEITEEEFERKMALLKKHGVGK